MSTAPPLKLKLRTPSGDKLITEGLSKNSTLADLKRKVEEVCQIPVDQQQLSTNYPPPARVITAPDSVTLADLKIMSNDLLLLKQIDAPPAASPPPSSAAAAAAAQAEEGSAPFRSSPAAPLPASLESLSHLRPLRVHPIANDNSCLFNATAFLIEGVDNSSQLVTELRQTVATIILADSDDTYNEAFLGATKQAYADTICGKDTWGGGIELAILADFWDVEIAALDVESCHQYVFGQSDGGKQKDRRIYLVYYGVHYDALEDADVDGPPRRVFHPNDQTIEARALLAARQLQAAGSFTNVSKFTLRCAQCQAGLVGAVEAQEHAKATGHANFEEYAK